MVLPSYDSSPVLNDDSLNGRRGRNSVNLVNCFATFTSNQLHHI